MTRCTYCRGSMFVQPVDTSYEGDKAEKTETSCLSCGRVPGSAQDAQARVVCSTAGCLRDAYLGGDERLCVPHKASSKRQAATRERSGMVTGGFGG